MRRTGGDDVDPVDWKDGMGCLATASWRFQQTQRGENMVAFESN